MTGTTPRVRPPLVALLALALAAAGLVVNLWRPTASAAAAATPWADFPAAVVARIADYRRVRWAAAAVATVLTAVVPLLVVGTAEGRRLLARSAGGRHPLLAGAAIGGGVAALLAITLLPLDVLVGYWWDGAWGLRTAGPLRWARTWLVGAAVPVVVAAVAGALLVLLVRRRPRTWPWDATLAATGLAALVLLIWPQIVTPLVFRTRPLPPGPVHDAVASVLARAGVDAELRVADASALSTRLNAFVAGWGPTQQVVLYDTLLGLPPEEVATIVAHELAHQQHADVARTVPLTATVALPVLLLLRWWWQDPVRRRRLGAEDAADPRLVAALAALVAVGGLVVQPAAMWLSRRAEAAADQRAVELVGDATPMVSLLRTFVLRDLAHPDPPAWVQWWWGTHPSPAARIRAAAATAPVHGPVGPPAPEWHPELRVGDG